MLTKTKSVIACVAGRSGGHIVPALSYARSTYRGSELIFFSAATKLDKEILTGRRVRSCYFLPLSDFPRKRLWRYPFFIVEFIYAFFKSFFLLAKDRPKVLINMGGYISIPVSLAAWLLRIPVQLFELNALPGRATKLLAPIASEVNVCFEDAKKYFPAKKINLVSYPLRFDDKDIIDSYPARQQLGLAPDKKTILILGGSQGSQFLNSLLKSFVEHYPEQLRKVSIIHQCGQKDVDELRQMYEQHLIHADVFAYRENIQVAYCAADFIISRAGAGSLFESAFFHKPTLIIPLEAVTTNHQVANAHAMRATKGHLFDLLRQKDIEDDPELFFSWLTRVIER